MKGNSERVPNKNLKSFGGKPLYHSIVKTLIKSKYITNIVIDTDSENIVKDVQENFGEKVLIIKRPKNIQGDYVSMNEIIAYDLSKVEAEHFIQTHSTNPLLEVETLDFAVEKYVENIDKYDSLFSVTRFQTRFYDKNAKPINHNPNELLRTQDLEPMYEENSNFYIFSKKSFKEADDKRIGLKPQIFEINKLEAVDIDEPEDFQLAELIYMNKNKL
ncbi:acylneuraminate cytidylyltransferase [Halarcobacter ebronensis]|uniref:Acylneuraminate cytidylyltransferase n=2 Tax=Halarcobacter ebronensis TaxID=1462615 RepID=A0A4V1LR38_9BACT|nr:acylneuraminate cytidylyltransferase [Halarcobacter ebronensis]